MTCQCLFYDSANIGFWVLTVENQLIQLMLKPLREWSPVGACAFQTFKNQLLIVTIPF
ncbi:Uncharacterised protein [Vibrio cholerae]|nr:Uncharacterised protein [Vibrio cholerae]